MDCGNNEAGQRCGVGRCTNGGGARAGAAAGEKGQRTTWSRSPREAAGGGELCAWPSRCWWLSRVWELSCPELRCPCRCTRGAAGEAGKGEPRGGQAAGPGLGLPGSRAGEKSRFLRHFPAVTEVSSSPS